MRLWRRSYCYTAFLGGVESRFVVSRWVLCIALPTECLLSIFDCVLDGHEPTVHIMCLSPPRVELFRKLAAVCRTWTGPARTVIWYGVKLLNTTQIVKFSRRFTLRLRSCSPCLHYKVLQDAEKDLQRYLPFVLNHLPNRLHLFKLAFLQLVVVIYECIQPRRVFETQSEDDWRLWAWCGLSTKQPWYRSVLRDLFVPSPNSICWHLRWTRLLHSHIRSLLIYNLKLWASSDFMAEPPTHITATTKAFYNPRV
jgi:F-box-like